MKRILIAAALLLSCEKEEITPQPEPQQPNCNCDRVADMQSFYMQTTTGLQNMCYYTTVNDCTGLNKHGEWWESDNTPKPKVGNCL